MLASCRQWSPEPAEGSVHPRIVSLNPCSDAILAEVAAPGQLLAISHFSHDPNSTSMDEGTADRYPETSGAVEEIAALEPDVVVASAYLPPATAQALRDMGIDVVMEPSPTDIPSAIVQIRALAKLVGNYSEGEDMVAGIERALVDTAPPPGHAPVPAVMWEWGGLVAGDDTLITHLMRRAGFGNAATEKGLPQAGFLPLEQILADPPRVVFTVASPVEDGDRMLRHPVLEGVKGMATVPLDRSLVWCGGPTIARALERFAQVRRDVARKSAIRPARAGQSRTPAPASSGPDGSALAHHLNHPSQRRAYP